MNIFYGDDPKPSPNFSPQDVVKIQLDALQNNDLLPKDFGIQVAYRFASPENRRNTGPLERFIQLVKNPLYITLIGFERAELGPMMVRGTRAQQIVNLRRTHGQSAAFVFMLSKQTQGDYANCWMTDGVVPQA